MSTNEAAQPAFLAGRSEMARLIRAHDWSPTLGPTADWPASLKTTLGLMLNSPVPLVLLWGPAGIMLYNDAYGGFAGDRHPGILGLRVLDAWPEVADLNSHVMAVGMAGGTLEYKDRELVLNRRGRPERGWMDLFYSPVITENGKPGGVIAVVVETTERVLAQRATAAQGERVAQMFQDAPSFMAQLEGPQHVFTATNAAYQQLIARRDVIGKPIRQALPELAGQGFFELLDRVYATGERHIGYASPVTLQRQPGAAPTDAALEERLLDFIYQPVRNAVGAVVGIFVEGSDVTERERATAAVRENARRLAFLDRLGRATASLHDADEILKTSTQLTGQHLGASICAYADMDADQDGFTIRGDWCAPGLPSIVGHYSLADFGVKAVTELGAGRPLIVNDNRRELAPQESATFQAIGISATICMPLVKEGRLTALMAVHHKEPHAWSDDELAVIREVTDRSWAHIERVRDEAAREESAERLRLAAAAGRLGTFDYDLLTGDLLWDDRCRELFGLPPDAPVDYDVFLAGVHPDDRAQTDQAVQRALDPAERAPFQVEYRTIGLEDGIERWIAATGHVFFATSGKGSAPIRFVGAVLDISAQKRAEEQLRASELLFRTMAQAMPNHVWTAPADGYLDWFNEQVYAYAGAAPGSLDGAGWKSIVHPDDLPAATDRWERALSSGQTYEVEMRLRRFDGAWRWHIARAVPVEDPAGQVTRWIGTNTDIQEQKEVSAALVDINAVLEQRVEERTSQLQVAEEALRQAQKMEAVGHLTGGLAHDFNNILQGITGALDRVQHRIAMGRPAEADRFLKAALESANRAAALTHRLLAFSRRQTLDPRPLDANRLIAGMEDMVRRTMGPAIAVEVVGAAGLWTMRVDGSQLESALLNLCINARDAMPDGGKLTIETANKWLDDRAARERGSAARAVRVTLRHRQRHGHDARRDRARFRSLLYHQAAGPRHRARALDDLRLRAPVGRPGANLFGDQQGHDHVPLLPPLDGRSGRGRRGRRRAGRERLRRDGAGGRRRRHGAHADRRGADGEPLPPAGGRRRPLGAQDPRGASPAHRHDGDRRRPARRYERPPARRRGSAASAGAQDPVHYGVCGECRRGQRASGARHGGAGQAVRDVVVCEQGQGDTGGAVTIAAAKIRDGARGTPLTTQLQTPADCTG